MQREQTIAEPWIGRDEPAPFVVVNPTVRFMIEVQYPLAGAAPVRLAAKSGVVSGKLFDGVGDTDA